MMLFFIYSCSRTVKKAWNQDLLSKVVADELAETRQPQDTPFFDLSTVSVATDHFSPDNKIGEGGFCLVYNVKFPSYIFKVRLH